MQKQCDFLVIGSGLAGLAYALKVADHGHVRILAKTAAPQTNTAMAQGGIAAVMSDEDSFSDHARDTLAAGAGLCREDIVRMVVETAPDRIRDLFDWGVRFDVVNAAGETVDLTREGGHSHRRILHVQDHTGQDIHDQLLKRAQAHPNIEILEHQFAIDLILSRDVTPYKMEPSRCLGAHVFDKNSGRVETHLAPVTVLATGGAGKVYFYTTNWSGATGDGIAMAFRAGCRAANMEFMQFHPTCLYHPSSRNFLISEALRGEGGELVNAEGQAFTKKFHPMGSLAPRDIVARSIDAEMKRTGANCVYLDMTSKSKSFIQDRFPVIYKRCLEFGIDMTVEPIPVVPAAHYLCGGILTDANACTDVLGLLAIGETACTGLHGANRLASNSLLECLVFADTAAKWSLQHRPELDLPKDFGHLDSPYRLRAGTESNEDEMIVVSHMWDEIRRLMWNYVGIVRTNRRLHRARSRLDNIKAELDDYYGRMRLHPDIIELRNIAMVADLTVRCALTRTESRGIHYNLDYPDTLAKSTDTILSAPL